MTARRARESPRLIAAAAVAAVVLVLIGLLIGSATAGGSTGAPTAKLAALRHTGAVQAAQLRTDARELASLRQAASTQATDLTLARRRSTISRVRARCWRRRALRPAARPVVDCATLR
jgi:hypothetical protein